MSDEAVPTSKRWNLPTVPLTVQWGAVGLLVWSAAVQYGSWTTRLEAVEKQQIRQVAATEALATGLQNLANALTAQQLVNLHTQDMVDERTRSSQASTEATVSRMRDENHKLRADVEKNHVDIVTTTAVTDTLAKKAKIK